MPGLLSLMRADMRGMVIDRGRGRVLYGLSVVAKLLLFPRLQAVLLFRVSHALYQRRLTPFAYYLQAVILRLSGAELHPAAQIGPGFCLVHSSGVVIGDRARIGEHFVCLHGVTVGENGREAAQPVIGNWVKASAGCKILGGIVVGDHALIGANSVVLSDIPPGGVAVGSPARVVKIQDWTQD